ncbi:MAG: hypothetical protein IT230_10850 [Flavobacteriales bacterium]|nr:hypothetical protein [Flavobacteriales bacterium]
MRTKYLLMAVVVAGSLLASGGCYYDVEADLYPRNFCDTASVTFSGSVQPILQGNCAILGCHVPGGTGTGDFTTYAGFLAQVQNGGVLNAIQHQGNVQPMPPSGKLPDCQIRQIELWVNAGALNN